MDLKALREQALEETTRFFWDKQGFLPDQDSEEWEEEYRRRFELVKRRQGAEQSAIRPPAPAADAKGADLKGAPAERRWAAALRANRLKEIRDKEVQLWLAASWTSAKTWIETRELPLAKFLHRVEAQYAEHLRQAEGRTKALEAERLSHAEAEAAIDRQIEAAGITAAGLIELIDVSPRMAAAPIKAKLVDVSAGGRSLRVFETGNPAVLMVIENNAAGRAEYAIERDEGLVADLKLYASGQHPPPRHAG